MGTTINNYILPPISDATSLGFALAIGLFLWVFSFVWWIIVVCFEKSATQAKTKQKDSDKTNSDEFKFKDIKEYGLSYWLIVFSCTFSYIGLFWFNNVSNDFFGKRYGISQTNAGRITSNMLFFAVFLSPWIGIITDKYGKKLSLFIFSSWLFTLSHILFIIIPSSNSEDISYLGIIPIVILLHSSKSILHLLLLYFSIKIRID